MVALLHVNGECGQCEELGPCRACRALVPCIICRGGVVNVIIETTREGVELPARATRGSSGFDLRAAEACTVGPGERKVVPCGFKIQVPLGYEVQVRARSGLALKQGITMANGIGTVDSDYRGEMGVIVINLSHEAWSCAKGDRIAQMVIMQVPQVVLKLGKVNETTRAEGGYGHTGVK